MGYRAIFLIILAFVGVLVLTNSEKLTSLNQQNPVLIKPIAPTPAVQNTEVHSSDGEMNLIMQKQEQNDFFRFHLEGGLRWHLPFKS